VDASERQILGGCRDGQQWALDLVKNHITPLVRHRVFNIDDHDDVVQECFSKLIVAWRRTPDIDNFWAFVNYISVCAIIDHNRRRRTRDKFFDLKSDPGDDAATGHPHTDPVEKLNLYQHIVARLNPMCRKIFWGLFADDRSYRDLATELGLTEVNLRVRLKRCRDKARELRGQE